MKLMKLELLETSFNDQFPSGHVCMQTVCAFSLKFNLFIVCVHVQLLLVLCELG